jgi:large subunit ribosomal protein L28
MRLSPAITKFFSQKFLIFHTYSLAVGTMARVCVVTGKTRSVGCRVIRKGQSKKSGGIGTHVVKRTKRLFKPNLQRIRIALPNGQVRRVWVAVKAIKAGLVQKVVS